MGKTRTRWQGRTYSRVVSGASGRVLVVDDNKVIRQLIRVNLELEGLEVVTASDGAECLEVVHQVRPDLVTLDVVMPRLDGLRTAARLRADPRTCDLPLAIISACTQYEVESGLEAGVDAFLSKPFDPAELVSLVRRLIEGTRGEGAPDRGIGLEAPRGVSPGRDLTLRDSGDDGNEHDLQHGQGDRHGHPGGPSPLVEPIAE
ncbi:response regulator [Streptomyces bobili]|uniref:response regulator n=1 Tax=Streptomyces bobili TaxID=67280 RepID=UPI003700F265